MKNYDIILASNSQRRKELLKYIFEDFKIIPSNIDERKLEKEILSKTYKNNLEKFSNLCDILSFEKCKDISLKHKDSLIISADTIVYDDKNYLENRLTIMMQNLFWNIYLEKNISYKHLLQYILKDNFIHFQKRVL